MILYYALTTYHIQCCVLHKLTQKSKEHAVLLLSDIHKNSVAFSDRYKNSGIFDDVILLGESEINAQIRRDERRKFPTYLIYKRALSLLKKSLEINISDYSEIYLCPDHFPFGWYVINKNREYHCFEEGCGVLSDNEFLLLNMSRNKTQSALQKKINFFGENDCAVEILADVSAQKSGYTNPKMTDFSVKKILSTLKDTDLKRVMNFFGVSEKIDCQGSEYSLVLTQHMANLRVMTLAEQHELYCLFVDYFLYGDNLIIKPHPDDIAGRYSEIFNNEAIVLPFAMPSELLPFVLKGKLKTAIAANSTAVRSLGEISEKTICFDNRFLTDFKYIPKYYAVAEVLNRLNLSGSVDLNCNELLLNELSIYKNNSSSMTDGDKNTLVLSDKNADISTAKSAMNKYLTVIFINEHQKYLWFDGEDKTVFCKAIPVFIDGDNGEKSTIYVYSEDENVLDTVKDISFEKELKYTGQVVKIHSLCYEDAEKIRMLEGVLAATEKRLTDYIEYKRKQDKKSEKLENGKKK